MFLFCSSVSIILDPMDNAVTARPKKGRGAVGNPKPRFDAEERYAVDDGWGSSDPDDLPPLRTSVSADSSRKIIARNDSPDLPFDRSINPYRGCEHGCVYCFARPTHAYLGLSPGLDFETKLVAKHQAADLLRAELAKPSYRPAAIALGTNTDPYQPIEKGLKITRQILEVLAETRHPLGIVTKSHLVTRDIDILAPMAREGLVRVFLSVTTLDNDLSRRMEPRASSPARRLDAIRQLQGAGIPCGVLAAPMIPSLNDHELENILEAAASEGARWAGYILLRLPLEIKELFNDWLDVHAPDRKNRILKILRESRGGKLYDSKWGQRMTGKGVFADLLARRFERATKRLGLNQSEPEVDCSKFQPPARDPRQFSLF
jgi:DNA repair photolyase